MRGSNKCPLWDRNLTWFPIVALRRTFAPIPERFEAVPTSLTLSQPLLFPLLR
jgi:hypothetical protein